MILQVEQLDKKMYEASFRIRRGQDTVGHMVVKGRPGWMEADVEIGLFGKKYALLCGEGPGSLNREKKRADKKETAYRDYRIDGEKRGSICQVERKTGMFSTANYQELILDGDVFYKYSKVFQTEGKNSIYDREKQIAQIDTSSEIVDDMHHYRIYTLDQGSAEISALFCAYMYLLTGFRPGQEVRKGRYKQASISFDKTFDDKYHPDFVQGIEP